jgi:glutathione synthase
VSFGPEREADLSEFDVVWLRQDPPFDMGYITTTHLLEMIHPRTLVVNDPAWVRNSPEKLLVLSFPDLTPPTAIARDLQDAPRLPRAPRGHHPEALLRQRRRGGVQAGRWDDGNLASLFELFTGVSREPLIVQKYLPEVTRGDKRVILVDGDCVGAINRVPAQGETRSNMHVGGRPEPVELSARDREICARIGPALREKGLVFVGIDVIGDWLTEINVTSPTGIQELERFTGVNARGSSGKAVERRRAG